MTSTHIVVETVVLLLLGLTFVDARPKLNEELEQLQFQYLNELVPKHFPQLADVTQAGIDRCFESIDNPNSSKSALFRSNATIRDVLEEYFTFFKEIEVSSYTVNNLLYNMKNILDHVLHCSKMMALGGLDPDAPLSHKSGFTYMSSADLRKFLGLHPFHGDSPTLGFSNITIQDYGELKAAGKCEDKADKAPASLDLRTKYKELDKIRNQGNCGSCWAFSFTGVTEGAQLVKKKKKWGPLAPQFLVDFDKSDMGCNGGNGETAGAFILSEGLPLESTYPYAGKHTNRKKPKTAAKIKSFCVLKGGSNGVPEKLRMHFLNKFGPMWFTMKAGDRAFGNYKSGIYNGHGDCGGDNTWHAITLVGYTPKAWIIRNSWSKQWGDGGYAQIARKKNTCGCDNDCGYAEA